MVVIVVAVDVGGRDEALMRFQGPGIYRGGDATRRRRRWLTYDTVDGDFRLALGWCGC